MVQTKNHKPYRPRQRPRFQAFEFIPLSHQVNLPKLGDKCYFVCSDLAWPEHSASQALLIGYSDVGGLAVLRLLHNGRPAGLRAVHYSRVFCGESEANKASLELQNEAKALYRRENDPDSTPACWQQEKRVNEIAELVNAIGLGLSDESLTQERKARKALRRKISRGE